MQSLKITKEWFICLLVLATTYVGANPQHESKGHEHHHQKIEVPTHVNTPQLEMALYPDSLSGYNLHLQSVNYRLEPPENADSKVTSSINGHAHLFINGKKVSRLYGPYTHINGDLLKTGVNNITVTLNSHDHDTWTVKGEPLTATITIDTEQKEGVLNVFSSSPLLKKTKE